jgi:DNA polymerase-3 subunit delta'
MAAIRARAQNCTGAQKPCDACPVCRRYLAGTHPDMHVLTAEKSIGVADIRSLVDALSMQPFEGGSHTVVIENADKMTPQAQNALLKTLEEPPSRVLFILVAENAQALLPTVVSRCRVVRFFPPSVEEAADALMQRGIERDRARLLARLAGGSIGQALSLANDEAYWDIRSRALKALLLLKGPDTVGDAALLFKNDKDSADRLLDALENNARDIMAIRDANGNVLQEDILESLARVPIDGAHMLQSVFAARRRLRANVNYQYTLEMLFFDCLGGQKI